MLKEYFSFRINYVILWTCNLLVYSLRGMPFPKYNLDTIVDRMNIFFSRPREHETYPQYPGQESIIAFSAVNILAVDQYAVMSPFRTRFPASQFNGLSASGSLNKANTALQAASNPHAGLHSFFKISKHTSPVLKWMFGWNIGVTNDIEGGDKGYSELHFIDIWKTPFSKGVSGGPRRRAVQCRIDLEGLVGRRKISSCSFWDFTDFLLRSRFWSSLRRRLEAPRLWLISIWSSFAVLMGEGGKR